MFLFIIDFEKHVVIVKQEIIVHDEQNLQIANKKLLLFADNAVGAAHMFSLLPDDIVFQYFVTVEGLFVNSACHSIAEVILYDVIAQIGFNFHNLVFGTLVLKREIKEAYWPIWVAVKHLHQVLLVSFIRT